ncbi:adenylate/guanylate cyclase [Magnetococcus marinus MC-1]|uniref:Adenylate/guanylate cyclase n=1 Tax=Magnetococcus marinus (strain ATCC BAA-1437 / JCM 17883 / MC-1) TaxID=156889 RepID=A0L6X3_MAGMM|nr:adenylate/guanylate cyclase domain-containing protein [Magnetococcus marinus]ABK43716.1 adenylate/guanylate cyclase [Magnetococcus marinus MC-1]
MQDTKKKKPLTFPIRVTMMSLLLAITLGLSGWLTWFNYSRSSQQALDTAENIITKNNDIIFGQYRQIMDPAYVLAEAMTGSAELMDGAPRTLEHPATRTLLKTLDAYPRFLLAYQGFEDGSFHQVTRLYNEPEFRQFLGAPDNAAYGLLILPARDKVGAAVTEQWLFLDKQYEPVAKAEAIQTNYDPRLRPWYGKAMQQDRAVNSGLYLYAHPHVAGLTISRQLSGDKKSVIGLDLPMAELARFLRMNRFSLSSKSFFFNDKKQITVFPDDRYGTVTEKDPVGGKDRVRFTNVQELPFPEVGAVVEAIHQGGTFGHAFFTLGGRDYVRMVTRIPSKYSETEFLAHVAPVDELLGAVLEVRTYSLILSLFGTTIALLLVFLISRRFSEAIQLLAQETDHIRQFQLDLPFKFSSHITELSRLGESMETMKTALRIFGQYVPKSLVKQLIQSQQQIQLGGESKEVTLLFTDVADFTTISEKVEAQELITALTAYFQSLGSTILDYKGTIDKYIGDAVMAFWNAPLDQPDHVRLGCMAALEGRYKSNQQNKVWREAGQVEMYTRFGMHTGTVVVGNVGSSDRMNYTAIGASVNLAARLEGLNKYYGTQILVSEDVKRGAGQGFLFRSVDVVVPKGAIQTTPVYELLGMLEGPANLMVDATQIAWCAQWEQVYAHYRARRWDEALMLMEAMTAQRNDDKLVTLFQARCQHFKENPPPEDWNGAEQFKTK